MSRASGMDLAGISQESNMAATGTLPLSGIHLFIGTTTIGRVTLDSKETQIKLHG